MGQAVGIESMEDVTKRVEERLGKIAVSGRYHKRPKDVNHDYEITSKVLGSGYNGQVHLGKGKTDGQLVAVKAFKLHGVGWRNRKMLQSECEVFLSMDHPHVARLLDVYESENMLFLVMECLSGGELLKKVMGGGSFTEKTAAEVAHQMLLAIHYMHSQEIAHRDIKLDNFLYATPECTHLKLIDFGFSKIFKRNRKMDLSCGTLPYCAPEVLSGSYTSQCDMWSLGVSVFVTLFGFLPFTGSEETQVGKILKGQYIQRPTMWSKVSTNAADFVKSLLVVEPESRLTADMALEHSWIQGREKMDEAALDKSIADALCAFGHVSHFRRACMSMMSWSLTDAERAEVRQAFLELDTQNSGVVTLGDFKRIMKSKFHMSDAEAKSAFESLHIDHEEQVHYHEFLAAMVSSRLKLHDDLLRTTFKRFDSDDSGFITLADLRTVLGSSFEGEHVEDLLKEVDIGGDGKISYEEFIEYLRDDAPHAHQEAAAKLIDKEMEQNGNAREKHFRIRSAASRTRDKQPGCTCSVS